MDFRSRINAVLHRGTPDRVPFAPYDNLVPRGDFERALRNQGMGMCLRRNTIWEEMPHVSIEIKNEGDVTVRTYHTTKGDLTCRARNHVGRIKDEDMDLDVEGLIKGVDDYETAIYLLEDTVFHMDQNVFFDAYHDVGVDGIVRDTGFSPPYGATRYLYGGASGLERWIQDQHDHPREFERLMQAMVAREERRLQLIVDTPAEYLSLGDVDGTWGPNKIRKYDLPLYQKWVPILKSKGKICSIHAHALNLSHFVDVIAEIDCDVVEAFTPPPVGDLSLQEARVAWGKDVVLWINFPETVFWSGKEATREYTAELIRSDPPGKTLVIGFTEMGFWGATSEETREVFRDGTQAVLEGINAMKIS